MTNNPIDISIDKLRTQILELTEQYADIFLKTQSFVPGETAIPVSGKVLTTSDFKSLVNSSLDGWLTAGRFTSEFEKELANFVGVRHALFVNSGSSANLLALSGLTSIKLGEKALKPGDEVITVAMGFPTTVNPIIQNGLIPVFVDIDLKTLDVNPELLEQAISPKTRAIMLAHTLGNPFNLDIVQKLCDKYNLWLIEDSCDALGSTYNGKRTGSFGDAATVSFYPAHHITTGEGGAVFVKSPLVKKQIESFRDWGRDCYCETGKDNTCSKRFGWQLGDLPHGYDHKYIYSHIGYNLKATDMQAAIGLSQLAKIESFILKRKLNFQFLYERLQNVEEISLCEATPNSDPAWFGFPITLKPDLRKNREDLLLFLNNRKIGTRLVFAGNMTKQPAYKHTNFKVIGNLQNSDAVMERSFWVGVYPGLSNEMLEYVSESICDFLDGRAS
jgi:CDP-6-deoxy-D-xylo-4-hexulose-3-dehydrase